MKTYSLIIRWRFDTPNLWEKNIPEDKLLQEIDLFLDWMNERKEAVIGFVVMEDEAL